MLYFPENFDQKLNCCQWNS